MWLITLQGKIPEVIVLLAGSEVCHPRHVRHGIIVSKLPSSNG